MQRPDELVCHYSINCFSKSTVLSQILLGPCVFVFWFVLFFFFHLTCEHGVRDPHFVSPWPWPQIVEHDLCPFGNGHASGMSCLPAYFACLVMATLRAIRWAQEHSSRVCVWKRARFKRVLNFLPCALKLM